MNQFAWALAGFVLIHVGLAATGLRARVVARIGEGPYQAFFSLASIALLAWLVMGYRAMRADPFDPLNAAFWTPPAWLMTTGAAIAFVGVALAIAGLLSPGPTLVGYSARALAQAEPARGLLRVTRHPFLWGVAFWALGHALANGERFAVMLFGALGVMALLGVRSIDRKMSANGGDAWETFEAATSSVPLAAIFQGRNRFAVDEIWWRLALGLAVAGITTWTHQVVFGVPALAALSGR